MSEFILALDAGMTSVTTVIARAAAHEELEVAPFTVGRERADIAVLAFITDDGDAIFGAEAAERGRDRPERLVHEFTRWIGDPAPIVVGGFVVSADELFARMVAWIAETVSAECGSLPVGVAIAHPTSWCGHRAKLVRERLGELGVNDVMMMPSSVIVAQQLASGSSRGHTIGVYDLGGSTFEATLLRGGHVLGEPQTTDVGGEDVDAALLGHVLSLIGRGAENADDRTELLAARQAIVTAKEALSFSADISVPVTLGGHAETVRVTRSELDAMASAPIGRTLGALERALESARIDSADIDEIVLVGGSARIPLVAQTLSAQFDRPLTVPVDPQFAVAEAMGRIAWARMPRRDAPSEAAAQPVAPSPTLVARRGAAKTRTAAGRVSPPSRGAVAAVRAVARRIPYGAAAATVAAAVIIAAGMVFASTTPLGSGSGAAIGSSQDGPSRGEPQSWPRTPSDYSVDSATPVDNVTPADNDTYVDADTHETDPSGGADVEDVSADRGSRRGGGPSTAPASEPGTESSALPSPKGDSTPTSTAPVPTSGPNVEPTADPAPVPVPDQAPEPASEPTTEPAPDAVADPDPVPTSAPAPTSDPQPASDPEPASDAAPGPDPVSGSGPESDPAAPEPPSATEPPREASPL